MTRCGRPLGIPPKRVPIVSTGSFQKKCGQRGAQHGDNRPGDSAGNCATGEHHCHGAGGQDCRSWRPRGSARGQSLHPQPEFSRNFFQTQAEEILDLGAGDQDRDSIGEAQHHGTRNEFHRRAHAGHSQHHQQNARHHSAHEQPVHPVHRDDAGHHHHKRSGRPSDLRLRSAQQGNQKSGNHGAVDARLRRQAGSNGEGHGQRQRDQTDRDAGNDVMQKFCEAVFAQAQNRLRQPAVVQGERKRKRHDSLCQTQTLDFCDAARTEVQQIVPLSCCKLLEQSYKWLSAHHQRAG